MDGRFLLNGRHLNRLLRDDLPIVARAITAAVRGKARVGLDRVNNVAVVHLVGQGFDLYLRAEDWSEILPYLADGTLSPLVTAAARRTGIDYAWEPADIDVRDSDLYQRVLGILSTLFTESFPTSNV